jgi:23S rRNA pseudouridine1911/1915/1917 synthase
LGEIQRFTNHFAFLNRSAANVCKRLVVQRCPQISNYSQICSVATTPLLKADPFVVYEDNHLIAISKPFGMPSQVDDSGDFAANQWVEAYLREKYAKQGNVYVGLLHRLDRPAGGLMLFAKTSKAAERMSAQFQKREMEKRYLAVTLHVPKPPAARLQHFLGPVPGKVNIMRAHDKAGPELKVAVLEYTTLQQKGGHALVEVLLETGRKHQIRVQLAKIGCGIVGDARYNQTGFLPDQSIALFSWKMAFEHPVRKGEWIRLKAPLPTTEPWNAFVIDGEK